MEVFLFLCQTDFQMIEQRLCITKLCRQCTRGSRCTSVFRPYRQKEGRNNRDKGTQFGAELDLPLRVPKGRSR